jgi:GTP-binding protein EngB required for normal cell division
MFASPIRPRTMTKEWQEATEEYLKVRRSISLFTNIITNTS